MPRGDVAFCQSHPVFECVFEPVGRRLIEEGGKSPCVSIERMVVLDCGGRAVRLKHRPRSTMPFCYGVCARGACRLVVPCPTI